MITFAQITFGTQKSFQHKMKKQLFYICIVLFSLLFFSCKTRRTGSVTPPIDTKITLSNIRTANFSSISLKASIDKNSLNSKASLKIIRDSIIQFSVMPMLGIEMARIDFTPTSILIINKLHGLYFQADYESLLKENNIPFRYTDVEALLLNRLFIAGSKETANEKLLPLFTIMEMPDGAILKNLQKTTHNNVASEFMLDALRRISYAGITFQGFSLRCNYSNFTTQDTIIFPFKYKLQLYDGSQLSNCEIQINNAEFNGVVKINTIDLSNYQQVDSLDLIYKN